MEKLARAIADVVIFTPVQIYKFISRQGQPGVVKDYWELRDFLEVRCKNHLFTAQFLKFCICKRILTSA